jgi:hypothetical protein
MAAPAVSAAKPKQRRASVAALDAGTGAPTSAPASAAASASGGGRQPGTGAGGRYIVTKHVIPMLLDAIHDALEANVSENDAQASFLLVVAVQLCINPVADLADQRRNTREPPNRRDWNVARRLSECVIL